MEVEDMWVGMMGRLEDAKLLNASVVLATNKVYFVIEGPIIGRYVGFDGLSIVDNFGTYHFSTPLHII